jgi:hypothetical protein
MSNRTDRPRFGGEALAVNAALAVALGLALGACGRGGNDAAPVRPQRLDGAWTVELRLEHSATLTRAAAAVPPVRGTVVLLENERARRIPGLSGVPTHYGVYSADLRTLDLGTAGQVPTLVARLAGADSVEIAFDPERGHAFVGRGTLEGDSIRGRWWTPAGRTVGRSSGRFTMRRP